MYKEMLKLITNQGNANTSNSQSAFFTDQIKKMNHAQGTILRV